MFRTKLYFFLVFLFLLSGCAAPITDTSEKPAPAPVPGMTDNREPLIDLDEFALIGGGSFIMGDIYGSDSFAKPSHKVFLDDFYIAKHEVTFEQYDRFCQETGAVCPDDNGWGRGNQPVVNISYNDAVTYANWLSAKTGRTFRLPTEAEWEYAARSGKNTNFWWGNTIGDGNANCRACGSQWDNTMTAPVGSFKPAPNGLYDMHGNVYEWVADSWHDNYRGAPADGTAWVEKDATRNVSRGGSFREIPESLYVSARNRTPSDETRDDVGFRLVLEP